MSTPKSAEEIRKLELSLEELVNKFQSRVQLIREDLQSLIKDIESLRNYIDERRRISNDYTREISDLTNDLQTFNNETGQIENEISSIQSNIDSVNTQVSQVQSDLLADKNKYGILDSEKTNYTTTLRSLEVELASLERVHNELKPKFETRMKAITQEYDRLEAERSMLANRFQAIRILCSKDYIQSPEVGLIKFLAKKPSPQSKLTEIHSALGMDPNTLKSVLKLLETRKVLSFDEPAENVTLLVKIDLFDKEV
jgi:predicted  nucleic acid-binding Zn-ribbon protein